MRICFFGSGEFAVPTLDSIHHDGHEIALVVTQPDKVRGRGKASSPTPLKMAALETKLPVITPENVNAPEVLEQLRATGAELGYVAAFGQKLGPEILSMFPAGVVNLHGSLLPELRGAAPVQWAVLRGLAQTGVTVFRLVSKMDAGPILTQRRTAIGDDETADELHDRLARIGCDAVRATLTILQSDPKTPGEVQDESKATLAPKLSKTNSMIRFDQPTEAVARTICGLWSWPGAICRFVSADGKRDELVTLARARPYEGRSDAAAHAQDCGQITEMLAVQVLDGELNILQIKPAGGKLMDWRDYVNGRHVVAGDRFVSVQSV